jgi:prepilin peptidase CpaA
MIASVLFVAGTLLAAWSDVRSRRVPNQLVLALSLVGLAAGLLGRSLAPSVSDALLGGAVGLALWLPLWLLRLLGAGDVKFFAASSLWLGSALAWRAALLAALAGGLLALAMLLRRRGGRQGIGGAVVQLAHGAPSPAGDLVAMASSADPAVRAMTLPYAVPMSLALLLAWFFPDLLLRWP